MRCGATAALLALSRGASAHGWITRPASKLELNAHHHQAGMPADLQYEPQSCFGPNSCGANDATFTEGLSVWQKWYDAAGVAVPAIVPGGELDISVQITADHGGQSWMMVACADRISEGAPWTLLKRASGDRGHHFMPSNPTIYAWAKSEARKSMGSVISARWAVPQSLRCSGGRAVGRWLWKTGNSCNDVHNVGRKTETFSMDEFAAVSHAFDPSAYVQGACSSQPEQFISCLDFVIGNHPHPPSPGPGPSPPRPTPPAPPPPSPAGQCHAISPVTTDAWCNSNCHSSPPNCPASLCSCGSARLTVTRG